MTDPRPRGFVVSDWQEPPAPPDDLILEGRHVRLEPLRAQAHAALLFKEIEGEDWLWDYMAYGPFHSAAQYHRWVRDTVANEDHLFYAIRDLEAGVWGGVPGLTRGRRMGKVDSCQLE